MRLYLIRHAHAEKGSPDDGRPLSAKGQAQIAALARWLRASGSFTPRQIWSSPLVRAAGTAVGLRAALDPEILLVETPDLRPEDDPMHIAARLAHYPTIHDLALVGHQPHLGQLVPVLLRGRPGSEIIKLKKGAVLCLERTERTFPASDWPRWVVRWLIEPSLFGA